MDTQNINTTKDEAAHSTFLDELSDNIISIKDITERTNREMRELHKLYHTEFAGRLKRMQDELDSFHEIERGRVFDDVLREVALVYSNNVKSIESVSDEKIRKQLGYMFEDLLQIVQNNGVTVLKSKEGDKRNTKHCQVLERITTDDLNKHDTVARSVSTGFYLDNRTLVKEMIDVYIYEESKGEKIASEEQSGK